MNTETTNFEPKVYGFQEFTELLNFAQDKTVVRVEPEQERETVLVYLGAEFYPPAPPPEPEEPVASEYDEKQPIVAGQPSMVAPTPPVAEPKPMKTPRVPRKRITKPEGDKPPRKRAPRKKT